MRDARDRLKEKDRQLIHIHLITVGRRITQKYENVHENVLSRATVTQGRDLVHEIDQRVGGQRVVLTVPGKNNQLFVFFNFILIQFTFRYRRKENVPNKDRRDERHRSPDR